MSSRCVARGCARPAARRKPCIGSCARLGEEKEAEQKKLYQKLVETTEQMVQQTRKVVRVLSKETQKSARHLVQQAEQMLPLVERVIAQTRTRVLEGKKKAGSRESAQPL